MAQRQFRSDDTSIWTERYGTGSTGDTATPDITQFAIVTGTIGNSTLNCGWTGTYPILIHQTQGTGAGNWELNYATGGNGSVMNLRYPLCNSYGTGAQAVEFNPYNNINITGTLNVNAWNGTTGGIAVMMAKTSFTLSGTINASGLGFRGFGGVGADNVGRQGEGTVNASGTQAYTANGNGGGGGGYSTNGPWDQGNGGGGGANDTTNGTNGIGTGGGQNQNGPGGYLGNAAGNNTLISMVLGGAGGSGGNKGGGGSSGAGGNGAGMILIIAKTISISGGITLTGSQGGGNVQYHCGAGGSGAGGSCLLKGQVIDVGNNKISASGGTRVKRDTNNYGDEDGGAGGDGRIHIDYSLSKAGTTTPSFTYTNDLNLAELAGGSFIWNLV